MAVDSASSPSYSSDRLSQETKKNEENSSLLVIWLRQAMKKSSGFFIAEGVSALMALIFLGLVLTSEPTLTHEEKFLWFVLYTYTTLNPTFMFLSILFMVSAVLGIVFGIVGVYFKYTESKETKPT